MAAADAQVLIKNLGSLVRGLRRLGFSLGQADLSAAVEGLTVAHAQDMDSFRSVLVALWCKSPQEIDLMNQAFLQWVLLLSRPDLGPLSEHTLLAALAQRHQQQRGMVRPSWWPDSEGSPAENESTLVLTQGASRSEVLQYEPLERLTDEEIAWLISWYRPRKPLLMRAYMVHKSEHGQFFSPSFTIRYGREGSEWVRMHFDDRMTEPLRLTVLIDMSGSMSAFHRPLLQFMHAMMRHQRGLSVYAFSTRLTSLTRSLRHFYVERALEEASGFVMDRGGGTRIAESVETLWRRERGRGLTARSTVVLVSDGFEDGDGRDLRRWSARLEHYVSGRFHWWNPYSTEDPKSSAVPSVKALADHTAYTGIANFHALNQAWAQLDRFSAL